MEDKFGSLYDVDGVEWRWWASFDKGFFNMNPPLHRDNLQGFMLELRDLICRQQPLLVWESPALAAANAKLCMKINEQMFSGDEKDEMDRRVADRASNPVPLKFLPAELSCLLVELES